MEETILKIAESRGGKYRLELYQDEDKRFFNIREYENGRHTAGGYNYPIQQLAEKWQELINFNEKYNGIRYIER